MSNCPANEGRLNQKPQICSSFSKKSPSCDLVNPDAVQTEHTWPKWAVYSLSTIPPLILKLTSPNLSFTRVSCPLSLSSSFLCCICQSQLLWRWIVHCNLKLRLSHQVLVRWMRWKKAEVQVRERKHAGQKTIFLSLIFLIQFFSCCFCEDF